MESFQVSSIPLFSPSMLRFLLELLKSDTPRTLLMIDEGEYKQFRVRARDIYLPLGVVITLISTIVCSIVLFTPIREWIWGFDPEVLQHEAQLQALRIQALEDSIQVQQAYLEQIRLLIAGEIRPPDTEERKSETSMIAVGSGLGRVEEFVESPVQAVTGPWKFLRVYASQDEEKVTRLVSQTLSGNIHFPAVSPVPKGILTRGFEPRIGHYAIDIAIEEGTPVHAIADGYVIFADWTQGSGYVIALQHAEGYVSIYKHNRELTRTPGTYVRSGEIIAFSGNTGEISSGPHVHIELWHNGVPLDPERYLFLP